MKCPHCTVSFFEEAHRQQIGTDIDGYWNLITIRCPNCLRLIVALETQELRSDQDRSHLPLIGNCQIPHSLNNSSTILMRPKGSQRPPCPPEVPDDIKADYDEACCILVDSPKASAALSRRCLQHMLHDRGYKGSNLSEEIDLVIKNGKLPQRIVDDIDAIRNIGNFAAHPNKSKVTGLILPVEPEEAEWNLDVIESLFDFFYVQPAIAKLKRDALNKKLQQAGKPPIK